MDDDDLIMQAMPQSQEDSAANTQHQESKIYDLANVSFVGGFNLNQQNKFHHKKSLFDIIVPMRPEDVFSQYFRDILKANDSMIALNIFIIGYKNDSGVRACGGRSGSELGPDNFRELLNLVSHETDSGMIELSQSIKESKVNIYDLGNVCKYQLSKYKAKGRRQSLDVAQNLSVELNHIEQSNQNTSNLNFDQLYNFIFRYIPKSKVIVIGGSDDIGKSVYESCTLSSLDAMNELMEEAQMEQIKDKAFDGVFRTVVHIDSQIDVKPKFMLQIEERDKITGDYLFGPTYHEHHRSYLREVFIPEKPSEEKRVMGIRDILFYGVQG
mmetsp:Transcript_72/g.145  ORF Transcript_72/g.145 Transcript_72/m.145 type:complete len:326 (-) Transcript_72:480-1457(-)